MRAKKAPSADLTVLERLRTAGLRPTRQRLALAKLLVPVERAGWKLR